MDRLFDTAEKAGVEIWYCSMGNMLSASVSGNDGCYIAMDYSLLWRGALERVHTAHELGHCMTGSFYSMYAPLDVREKHEYRADRWAVRELLPEREFKRAVKNGYACTWELAEYFNVTEDLVRKAAVLYHAVA